MTLIKNAKILPKVYYGLHMVEGVAEYAEGAEPYRIFIGEQTIKNMDASFQGRPVYVHHVDEVDMGNLHNEADGFVVRSFFNKSDGKHWAEFLVTTDKGHEAIRSGWKLSNAYLIKNSGAGGRWHAVDYAKEVTQGEYEHLAIVPNPRYDESIILTPDQFKAYNDKKEAELVRLSNSTGDKKMKFNFFKKEKIENSIDIEAMSVLLPKTGIEVSISTLITNADDAESKKNEKKFCNGEDSVKIDDEEMTLNSFIEKYNALKSKNEEEPIKEEKKEDKKENEEEDEDEKKKKAEKKENEEEEDKEKEEKKKNNFDKLKNAQEAAQANDSTVVETSSDKVARGQSRYGSK